jgi:hypothetical protein
MSDCLLLSNKQHLALKIALNGLFPEPLRALLTSGNPNEKRKILAIGMNILRTRKS